MNSSMLKHQARLQEWALTIQECRTSGLSVKRWCQEKGITAATYYRWERELLSIAGALVKPNPLSPLQNYPLRNKRITKFRKVLQHFRLEMAALPFTRN